MARYSKRHHLLRLKAHQHQFTRDLGREHIALSQHPVTGFDNTDRLAELRLGENAAYRSIAPANHHFQTSPFPLKLHHPPSHISTFAHVAQVIFSQLSRLCF
ncbi:MAG: hypothetical protein AAFV46_12590 [Cyanobacteria bacterium J06635_11]